MILAILYKEKPHMLPAKYKQNRHNGSGKEVVWMIFTIYGHDKLQAPNQSVLKKEIFKQIHFRTQDPMSQGHFRPQGLHLNKFENGPLGNATY